MSFINLKFYFKTKKNAESTHIRILAFSPDGITNCSVSINYQPVIYCTKASDNLFVVKWDPNLYKTGSHVITVRVIDGVGRDAEVIYLLKDRSLLSTIKCIEVANALINSNYFWHVVAGRSPFGIIKKSLISFSI